MNKGSILFAVGFILSVTGAVLAISWGYIFTHMLYKELELSPTSRSFTTWRDTPVPMYLDFYFWNWTNPHQILDKDVKPNLIEMGPYRFRERHEKVNVTWNANDTLTYQRVRRWYFDPEHSNGTLTDNVTTINAVALSAAYVARGRSALMQMPLSGALRMTGQKIWVTRTVGEFLFDGYSDPILTMAVKMPHLAQTEIPADKFGWFYQRNGSVEYDGLFNIDTGAKDIARVGLLSRWNYRNTTKFYEGHCGQVNGSAGELWPPERKRENPVEMYSTDLCRSVKFEYCEDTEVEGIAGYKYIGGKNLMDNGTDDPSTWCFCGGQCIPQGVLNVSSCRFGAPAFVSYPHFFDADPFYSNLVRGMNPDPERHQFRITLEPTTGIPLDVAARFQINLLLQPSTFIAMYSDVPTIFFPMMWFDQRAALTADMAQSLRMLLALPQLGLYLTLGILCFGILLLLVSLLPRICRSSWDPPKHGEKGKSGAVRYTRECIRPLLTGSKDKPKSSASTSDPNLAPTETSTAPLSS